MRNNKNSKIVTSKDELRNKILQTLKDQGFNIDSKIVLPENDKKIYHKLQSKSRLEQLAIHKKFLQKNLSKVRQYCKNGSEIEPNKITLKLIEVKPGTLESLLFKWWNMMWWSIPYQHSVGRQIRFLLWDTTHNTPFGLILLQSPVLKMSVRDKYLEIPRDELDLWINRSMYAQRVGALPPYNELIGGKMIALTLVSNEIRDAYKRKYSSTKTLIKKRTISPDLLFISTTSAFGRSSIYNRLKYKGKSIAISLGYTKGSGTFHVPDSIYEEMVQFLSEKGLDTARGCGHGPSRKLRLISTAFRYLDLPNFTYHGIKREFYLFPLVENLKKVIKKEEPPIYTNYSFDELFTYWKHRWALPRADRKPKWKNFKADNFFKKAEETLSAL